MPPRPINWRLYIKMVIGGSAICIGGPALVYYVSPTEEELFKKYNPDLQKRSLENRIAKQQEFDDFVGKLKEYSKSDKPIWEAVAQEERNTRGGRIKNQENVVEESRKWNEEVRREVKSVPGGS